MGFPRLGRRSGSAPATSSATRAPASPGERRSRWLSTLNGVLLVGLSVTVAVLVITRPEGPDAAILPGESRTLLIGLVGLVVLFVLYTGWQQGQLRAREAELREVSAHGDVLRERLDELASLLEVTSALAENMDLKTVLTLAAKRVVPCLDADHAAVYLFNPRVGRLEEVASSSTRVGATGPPTVTPDEGVIGYVYANRDAFALESEEMRARLAAELGLTGTPHAALCAPIRFRRANLGVFCVARIEHQEPFAAVHVRALQAVAEHCGAAIVKDFHYQRAGRRKQGSAA
ncbi:MAG TPA: GAF domain-containing protein [Terriglobales bacterium]|nr:GAF domain-containing protein [Terriglobales bacterium]